MCLPCVYVVLLIFALMLKVNVPSHHAQPVETIMTSAKSAPNLLEERQRSSTQNSPNIQRKQKNIVKHEDNNSEDEDEQETMLLQTKVDNLSLRDSKKMIPKDQVKRKGAIKELLSNAKLLNTSDSDIQNTTTVNDEVSTDPIPYTGVRFIPSIICITLVTICSGC